MERADLDILWILAGAENLLLKVEDFLTNADQSDLSGQLNKLQQDVAVQIAAHLNDPLLGQTAQAEGPVMEGMDRFLADASAENLHTTPHLLQEYRPITFQRLCLLSDVQAVLEAEGSKHKADFDGLIAELKPLLPAPFPVTHASPKPAQP